jgi:hypothetical protein
LARLEDQITGLRRSRTETELESGAKHRDGPFTSGVDDHNAGKALTRAVDETGNQENDQCEGENE